jgi:GNAT superfamily N-acetyltransferase
VYDVDEPTIRAATPSDSDAVIAFLQAGFRTFADFEPGWESPDEGPDAVLATEWVLRQPATWLVIAEDSEGHAGQCGFHPAHTERLMRGDPIPGLAHFWQLFVRRDLWGSGLAERLHDMALAEIHARGYARTRLFTPAVQARARRFYEARGWRLSGRSVGGFGEPPLELVEYERDVAP